MDPFKKKDPQVEADTLREVVRDSLNKRKKPVKFTFEGLKNLGFLFETNPFNKLKQERIGAIRRDYKKLTLEQIFAQDKRLLDWWDEIG